MDQKAGFGGAQKVGESILGKWEKGFVANNLTMIPHWLNLSPDTDDRRVECSGARVLKLRTREPALDVARLADDRPPILHRPL